MTKEECKLARSVMEAWENGSEIQGKMKKDTVWVSYTSVHTTPEWNWRDGDYRVKPEPLEIEVLVHPVSGDTRHSWVLDYMALEKLGYVKKKFREVL